MYFNTKGYECIYRNTVILRIIFNLFMYKIKPTLSGRITSYSLVGLGFISVDFITSYIDNTYRRKYSEQF